VNHGAEAEEHGRDLVLRREELGLGKLRLIAVADELAVGTGPAGMDDALRNSFAVEAGEFLKQMEVVEQHRAIRTCRSAVLVIADGLPAVFRDEFRSDLLGNRFGLQFF